MLGDWLLDGQLRAQSSQKKVPGGVKKLIPLLIILCACQFWVFNSSYCSHVCFCFHTSMLIQDISLLLSWLTPRRRSNSQDTNQTWSLRPNDSMEEIAGRMAQMEAVMQALRKQQQHEASLQTATTALVQNVQMERLIGVLSEKVESELGGRPRCWQTDCLPDWRVQVPGEGQEGWRFSDWHWTATWNNVEFKWASGRAWLRTILERTKTRLNKSTGMRRWWCRSKLYWHISQEEKADWSCRLADETDWKRGGLHKRFAGVRRRNLMRAILAPQRVQMGSPGSALQT